MISCFAGLSPASAKLSIQSNEEHNLQIVWTSDAAKVVPCAHLGTWKGIGSVSARTRICRAGTAHIRTPKQGTRSGHTLTLARPTCGGRMTNFTTPPTQV